MDSQQEGFKNMLKYVICFVCLFLGPASKASDIKSETPQPNSPYFSVMIERYDLEEGHPGKNERVVFLTLDDFMFNHERAILNTEPERLVTMFNRYVSTPNQFVSLGRTGGGNLVSLLENPEIFSTKTLLSFMIAIGRSIYSVEFLELFSQENKELFAKLTTTQMSESAVQEILDERNKEWVETIGFFPLLLRQDPMAHLTAMKLNTKELVDSMEALEFFQTKTQYETLFDFKHQQRLETVCNIFLAPNRPLLNFQRTRVHVLQMLNAAYNPFAPHYSKAQLDSIVRIHLKKWAEIDCPQDQDPQAYLMQAVPQLIGTLNTLIDTHQDKYDSTIAHAQPSELNTLMTYTYGYGMVYHEMRLHSLNKLVENLKILESNPQAFFGFHRLQGLLDTANFLNAYLAAIYNLYKSKNEEILQNMTRTPGPKVTQS